MKFLHFTDIHLTAPGQTIGGRDPNANLERALAHALGHHPDAEALFITGDLSDWGDEDDYLRLRGRIATLPLPVHLCIGNHDDRATFLRVFPEYRDSCGHAQRVVPLGPGRAILLDTWGPESHAGFFCERRANWLAGELAALDGPVWLFLHHNPVATGVAPFDQIRLIDADRLGAVLEPHRGRIRHIFHGHCHMSLSGTFRGIPFSAPRGTNHAGFPDFGATTELPASDLCEAYAVAMVDDHSSMILMVEFGYRGPVRAEGPPDKRAWVRETMQR